LERIRAVRTKHGRYSADTLKLAALVRELKADAKATLRRVR